MLPALHLRWDKHSGNPALAGCRPQSNLAHSDAAQKDDAGTPQASHAQRRQSAAQARYLAAVKQLALACELLKPAPTALQLLRFPVDETAGDNTNRLACRGQSSPTAGAAR
ncbi:MAG TPA: hypothetical protein VG013_01900 [Gemmataceae bacterium]|jgi:hypothetical protein|nr:hypothetical protein [Gemmataceae bacterium]